jgi:hypothetical protein
MSRAEAESSKQVADRMASKRPLQHRVLRNMWEAMDRRGIIHMPCTERSACPGNTNTQRRLLLQAQTGSTATNTSETKSTCIGIQPSGRL